MLNRARARTLARARKPVLTKGEYMKFKLMILGYFLNLLVVPCIAFSAPVKQTAEELPYKIIHAKELKSWIDSGKQFQLIDARPKKYDDGDVITGAKFLPYNSEEQLIKKMLPARDAVIVVYCASLQCPASKYLAEKLLAMGYKNVYKYPEGINDWMDKDYPIEKAQVSRN